MRVFLLASTIVFLSPVARADDDRPEIIEVKAPADTVPPGMPGTVGSGNPPGSATHCSEPDCGGHPEDPSGGDGKITKAQKDKQNRDSIAKVKIAKAIAQKISDVISGIVDRVLDKLSKLSISSTKAKARVLVSPDGGAIKEIDCETKAVGHDPCIDIMKMDQKVIDDAGHEHIEMSISFTTMNECYYNGGCPVETFTFVVKDAAELNEQLRLMHYFATVDLGSVFGPSGG